MKNLLILFFLVSTISVLAQTNSGIRTIEVKGSAEIEIQPDEILFIIGIQEYWKEEFEKKKDPEDYKTKVPLAEIEDNLIKTLRKAGIEKEDVKVRNIGNYWRQQGKEFLFSKQLEVEIHDFSKINDLVNLVDAKGIRNMSIGELRHSKMKEFQNQVKVDALKNAREKAEVLVQSIGEELGEVISISETSDGFVRPYAAGAMMMRSDEMAKESIDQIQNIHLEYQVSATFLIK